QNQPPLPWISGSEFAGVITALPTAPSSPPKFKLGDRVFGAAQGGFATHVLAPEGSLRAVPRGWSFDDAAGLFVTAPTGYGALVTRANVQPGEWVLVHAAAGGVGLAAVQVAKARGAKVIATAGTAAKLAVAKSFGADYGVDYGDKKWTEEVMKITGGKGVDVVFDPVGMVDISLKCTAWNGRIVVVGFAAGKIEKVAMNRVLLKNVSLVGLHWGRYIKEEPPMVEEVWAGIFDMIEKGQFRGTVFRDHEYVGLETVPAALEALGSRGTWGKVVIKVPQGEESKFLYKTSQAPTLRQIAAPLTTPTMSEEDKTADEVLLNFKVKTSSDGLHNITIPDSATVLDLKTKLASEEYENVPTDRQRLIYSGRVLKNEEHLATYKIKNGNTIHMVKSAASNAAQNPANAGAAATPSTGVPTNMAAGTANNPLANLTGARYAGQVNLPSRDMFGVDGGMGAPPNEDQVADMLSDPATAQMMNEALNNPQMVDMMIQANPTLRALGPAAREMLQSPMFRQMMTDPNMIRQAARMQRQMGGAGGASAFPAPGVTDTTPADAAGAGGAQGQAGSQGPNAAMLNMFGGAGAGAGNPFASLFQPPAQAQGQGGAQSPPAGGATSPGAQQAGGQAGAEGAQANPFANLFSGGSGGNPFGGNPYGLPPPTPEQMRQAMQMFGQMGGGEGGANPFAGLGGAGGFGGGSGATSPPPPADTRPPEEVYADQLRALNDMGFFDFEANVRALRRSGGSVQGAVEQLLG
ncbi:hypothetical protein V490_02950, partial [Pseudogymnoascus sp. VKM F-3557]